MTPRTGDFGLTRVYGSVGFLIRLGQFLYGSGWSRYEHAFVIVDDEGAVVEAEPGGARRANVSEYDPSRTAYSHVDLTEPQRQVIAALAVQLVGTPYSALDYVSLALHRLHVRPHWVREAVTTSRHMICSQLVDYVYAAAGRPLFEDRFPGDVTPADLAEFCSMPGDYGMSALLENGVTPSAFDRLVTHPSRLEGR